MGRPIGLQLYTVRDAVAKDLPGTLRAIADIGYREVELAGIPAISATDLRKMLNDCGLTAPSMHASMADLQEGLQERIDYAKALGTRIPRLRVPVDGGLALPRQSRPRSRVARLRHHARRLEVERRAAEQDRRGVAKQAGLRCGYHNHNMEFRSYDGVVAYDELLRLTDPALVTMEMDIAWVVTAGVDPVKYLKKHADRISMLHVKEVRQRPARDRRPPAGADHRSRQRQDRLEARVQGDGAASASRTTSSSRRTSSARRSRP